IRALDVPRSRERRLHRTWGCAARHARRCSRGGDQLRGRAGGVGPRLRDRDGARLPVGRLRAARAAEPRRVHAAGESRLAPGHGEARVPLRARGAVHGRAARAVPPAPMRPVWLVAALILVSCAPLPAGSPALVGEWTGAWTNKHALRSTGFYALTI